MDIHIHNYPPVEPEEPQPNIYISPNTIRKIFKAREPDFDLLVRMGWSEEEASKMVIADSLRKK